jgi:hypothetical protein
VEFPCAASVASRGAPDPLVALAGLAGWQARSGWAISVSAHAITLGEFARKRSRYSLRLPSLLRRSFSRDSALLLPLSLECQLLFAIMLAHFSYRYSRSRLYPSHSLSARTAAASLWLFLLSKKMGVTKNQSSPAKNMLPWRRSMARRLSARPRKQGEFKLWPASVQRAAFRMDTICIEGLGPMRT